MSRKLICALSFVALIGCDEQQSPQSGEPAEPASASAPTAPTPEPAPPKPRAATLEEMGTVCIVDADTPPHAIGGARVESEKPVVAEVVFDECGSACAKVVEASCEGTRTDKTIRVTGKLTVQPAKPGQVCTEQCVVQSARCPLGTLEAGEYTLLYGQNETTFEVPSDKGACVENQ